MALTPEQLARLEELEAQEQAVRIAELEAREAATTGPPPEDVSIGQLLPGGPVEDPLAGMDIFDVKPRRVVAELPADFVHRGTLPTPQISVATGEPIEILEEDRPPSASFQTLMKAALVKDPRTKMRIFADARGLPVENYGIKDDEIIYRDTQGNIRSETNSNLTPQQLIQLGASIAGDPAAVLGGTGAFFGPEGAVVGGLIGETLRQTVAGLLLDDPQTAVQNVANLTTEGVLAATTEFGAKGVTSAVTKIMNRGKGAATELVKLTDGNILNQVPELLDAQEAAARYGISLDMAAASENSGLVGMLNLLRSMPQTSAVIQAQDKVLSDQIQRSVPRYLREISTDGLPSTEVGKRLVDVSNKAVKDLAKRRGRVSSPLYQQAFAQETAHDVAPVIQFIDRRLEVAQGDVRKNLEKLRKTLLKPGKEKPEPGQILNPVTGRPFLEPTEDFVTSLEGLHDSKIAIDSIMARLKPEVGSGSKEFADAVEVRRILLDVISPDGSLYNAARTAHAILSEPVDLAKFGLEGVIDKTNRRQVQNVTSLLLSSKHTTPEIVDHVKNVITQRIGGQEIWDASVRDFLNNRFRTIKLKTPKGETRNVGALFEHSLMGDVVQRDILKKALGADGFSNLESYLEILRKTGLTFRKVSEEISNKAASQKIKKAYSGGLLRDMVRARTRPLVTEEKVVVDKLFEIAEGRSISNLADILLDRNTAEQLATLKKLPAKSKELIESFITFSGMLEGGQFIDQATTFDTAVPQLEGGGSASAGQDIRNRF